jgi:hypothetical protein
MLTGYNIRLTKPALLMRAGDWFHFWDRDVYGEPQFGDEYGAKRYKTKAGALTRVRHLERFGLSVEVVPSAY